MTLICLPSMAPKYNGKFAALSKLLAIINHSSLDGIFIHILHNSVHIVVHTSRTIKLIVFIPILNVY